jgi:hypothetical protein
LYCNHQVHRYFMITLYIAFCCVAVFGNGLEVSGRRKTGGFGCRLELWCGWSDYQQWIADGKKKWSFGYTPTHTIMWSVVVYGIQPLRVVTCSFVIIFTTLF